MEGRIQSRDLPPDRFVWAASAYQPFMSSWAIWSMLCDTNALTATSAKALLAGKGLHGSVFRARGEDAWLAHASSLSDQQLDDACCTSRFHPSSVATAFLRFCPKCMERGFHCGCFQHLALTRCPLHDLPLADRCTRCGAPISVTFETARTALYSCRRCEGRLVRDPSATKSDSANDAIWRSTITSLVWDGQSTPRRFSHDRTSIEAGCCSWWGGLDPFVAASTWRPRQLVVPAGSDNFSELAWKALLALVQTEIAPTSLQDVLILAHCLLNRTPLPSRVLGMPRQTMAMSCLIAKYGGFAAYERASRLSLHSAPDRTYWLFPQTSATVLKSAVGNAVIVNAELRAAYACAVQIVSRGGVYALPDDYLPGDHFRVPWAVQPVGDDRVLLQWRAPGMHRTVIRALRWRP